MLENVDKAIDKLELEAWTAERECNPHAYVAICATIDLLKPVREGLQRGDVK